MLAIKC